MTGEGLERVSVPALDEILGKKFHALDDGFVRVVDYMGDDSAVVQAARISYGKGTKTVSDDRGLIRYLMRHRHTTPFEMCDIKLHIRMPMDSWRQMIRHRAASVNEYSTRYSEAIDACQKTLPDKWRLQAIRNKQGSEGYVDPVVGEELTKDEGWVHENIHRIYKKRLDRGVAREQARKDLTLSTYTEAYWEIDLHNLLHFLALRMDQHAQEEIRSYATIIGEQVVAKWVPMTWEAFKDYRLDAMVLSKHEVLVLRSLLSGLPCDASTNPFFDEMGKGEVKEACDKLKFLGVSLADSP